MKNLVNKPEISMLSSDDIRKIHLSALEVLEDVGSYIESDELLDVFEKAGAKINRNENLVFMPRDIIEDAIKKAPSSFGLYNSEGEKTVDFGDDKTYYATNGYGALYQDWQTGEVRECSYNDLVEFTKLSEMLDAVDVYQTSAQPNDKPSEVQDLYLTKAALLYTKKPFHVYGNGTKGAEAIVKMIAESCGGISNAIKKPRVIFNITTLSPLSIREDAWEVVKVAGKYKLPVHFTTGPMAGATSPVTLAGELVEAVAELLLHLVMTQLCSPGMPVLLGSWTRIFDMKFGTCTVGTPEFAMMRAAMAQIINSYNLPCSGGGCLTDSNAVDSQHGWEKFMTAIMPELAGMNCIFGLGMISQLIVTSPESLVLDAEIVDTIRRIKRGIIVDKEHIALDVIRAEARKGDFLGNEHTAKHFRSEIYFPKVTDRTLYEVWQSEGEECSKNRAGKMVGDLLNNYTHPVNLEMEKVYDGIIEETMNAFNIS